MSPVLAARPHTAPRYDRPPAASWADPDAERTCSIFYIRRELGRGDYSDRRLISYLDKLIADHGFPQPLPVERRGKLVTSATLQSRWLRAAVDDWVNHWMPATAAARADAAQRRAAAESMDRNAIGLTIVRGGKA